MWSHQAFATAKAAGASEHLFDSPSRQKLWSVLAAHFETTTAAPTPDAIRLQLGSWADALVEVESTTDYAGIEDVTSVVNELLIARQVRSRDSLVKQAQVALSRGDVSATRKLLESVEATNERIGDTSNVVPLHRASGELVFRSTAEIFAPLPETQWVARGLQMCPGRPMLIAGYGASAKTLASQQMALAVATGRPIWDFFASAPGLVRHLDYEQGWHATAKRYQRLALGHGIDSLDIGDRLALCTMPLVTLDSAGALDAYSKAADGASLVIVDALRGATPSSDENDSSIRGALDVLTRVSERTGATFVVLHHAGKPKDSHDDTRTIARGSSAIFDAAGCVLVLRAGKTGAEPKRVTQTKSPAEAEGAPIDDFVLVVEDVALGSNKTAGVRVAHRSLQALDPDAKSASQYESEVARLIRVITESPGLTQNQLVLRAGMKRPRAIAVLAAMVDDGRIAVLPGPRGAKTYRSEVS
jgi:hypothetical protein